jgi:hypothetical protein
VAAGRAQLRVQVVRAHRLLERLPAAVAGALVQHLLDAAGAEHAALAGRHQAARAASVSELEANKRGLHPAMLYPSRRADLEALQAREAARQAAAGALTAQYAEEVAAAAARGAPALQGALQALARLLLRLLDGFVLPGDLPPAPAVTLAGPHSDAAATQVACGGGDAAWTGSGLARRDLRQLERLSLAQQEVPPAEARGAQAAGGAPGAAGEARASVHAGKAAPVQARPESTKAGAAAGGAVGVAAAKPGSSAAGERASKAGAAAASKAPAAAGGEAQQPQQPARRPGFVTGTWLLPGRHLDLSALGWPDAPRDCGSGGGSSAPAAVAAAGAGGSAAAGPAAEAAGPARGVAGAWEVSALDTPCHRACVRAYLAALRRVEARTAELVAGHRERMAAWTEHERRWRDMWGRMVQELDTI